MIGVYMNGTYETKRVPKHNKLRLGFLKYGADKIALFGFFVVALLVARFIVASRFAIVLSEPIKLDYAGLSVSIPVGNGWQSEKQWKYQEDTFTLSSFFDFGSGSVTALVYCRYLLAAPKSTPDILFKEKASAIGGAIAETGQTVTGGRGSSFPKSSQNGVPLTIDWAHIKKPRTLFDTFIGTAQLPNNRQLNIEVYQTASDTELAEVVFKRIVESLKFKGNQLLEAGGEIVAEIKSKGLNSFLGSHFWGGSAKGAREGVPLDSQRREDFFLIKDVRGRTIGFTMDVLTEGGGNSETVRWKTIEPSRSPTVWPINMWAVRLFYVRDRYTREETAFFQSRNNLDEFAWKSEVSGPAGRSSTEVVLDKAGIMTVRKYGVWAKEKTYQLSPVAIPDVFGEFAFGQMLDSNQEKIFLDIVEADGTILPTLISRIEAKDIAASEEAAYVFGVEFLDGRGFSQQIYLDDQMRITKRLLRQESIYTLERTSIENILRQFPEQAEYILHKE